MPHGKYSSGIRHANFLFNAGLLAGLFVLPCAAAVPDAAQNRCHIFQCGKDGSVCGGPAGSRNHSSLKIYPFLLHGLFQTQITSSVWSALWAMNNWHNGGAARYRSKQQGTGAACWAVRLKETVTCDTGFLFSLTFLPATSPNDVLMGSLLPSFCLQPCPGAKSET